jgi:hypothetical protein
MFAEALTVSMLRRASRIAALAGCAFILFAAASQAQTTVTLPDTSQTTTLTAVVNDQARVSVPSGVTFTVDDIASNTVASEASVTVTNIVLATASKQLKISLQSDTASFTPPVGGATTWSASDVSWNAASWTNASGTAGTLSSSAYTTVATCTADAASCNTTALAFTLAARTTVKRSGNHTLVVRWKFESI